MQLRWSKSKVRRGLRSSQFRFEHLGHQAEDQLEQNFFRRFGRLRAVRRFVISWLLLFCLLIGCTAWQLGALSSYYQTLQPAPGGIYSEGIQGDFTNANPLYAASEVDSSISRLIFAGLFKYDQHNKLVGDLARDYSVNANGTVYTVTLKPGLRWQDNMPLTSADVAFTYSVIQNPDAQSPLEPSWRGITVKAISPTKVSFTLPTALSSFPYEMTNGIVPQHLLKNVQMANMRSTQFNTASPIGAGPFKWKTLQVDGDTPETREEQVALIPFTDYNGGAPKLSSFIVHAFHDQNRLISSYQKQTVTAIAGLDHVPSQLAHDKVTQVNSFTLTAEKMAFFNNSNTILNDTHVRQALVSAANVPAIIKGLNYQAKQVHGPLLAGQLGYSPQYAQAGFNLTTARQQLDADGWTMSNHGVRAKGGKALRLTMYSADDAEDSQVANQLARQWQALGVDTQILTQQSVDLQQTIASHSYDILLHSIAIGVDPDVFVYWDSSQADVRATNRLNLSEYKSPIADAALEGGRTRQDAGLRVIKYKPFLQAWQTDAPALALYQPRFIYLTRQPVYNLAPRTINSDSDRFFNVQDWEIHQVDVTNP